MASKSLDFQVGLGPASALSWLHQEPPHCRKYPIEQHGHKNSGSLQVWACATVIHPSSYTGLTKKGLGPFPASASTIFSQILPLKSRVF